MLPGRFFSLLGRSLAAAAWLGLTACQGLPLTEGLLDNFTPRKTWDDQDPSVIKVPGGLSDQQVRAAILQSVVTLAERPRSKAACVWSVDSNEGDNIVVGCRNAKVYTRFAVQYSSNVVRVAPEEGAKLGSDGRSWQKDLQASVAAELTLASRPVYVAAAQPARPAEPRAPVAENRTPSGYSQPAAYNPTAAAAEVQSKLGEHFEDLPLPKFSSTPRPDDVAILVGIERYRAGLPNADFAAGDASLLRDYLRALGFTDKNMRLLVNDQATLSDIRKAVEFWLPNNVKQGSRVVFYYSGHGAPDPASSEAFIVPFDGDPSYLGATGYPLKQLYGTLGKLPSKEVVVLLDSCFSGVGGRSVLAKGARPLVLLNSTGALSPNLAVLSSTAGNQISTSLPEKRHGLFTYHLLRAIGSGKLDLAEIYGFIKPTIEDAARRMNVEQSPSLNPPPTAVQGRFGLGAN